MKFNKIIFSIYFLSIVLLGVSTLSFAAISDKILCVYDPVGANGPVFNQMRDFKIAALDWQYSIDLQPYLNEQAAIDDFKKKKCDAVIISGIRTREFNSFTSATDAIGALPSYKHLKSLLKTLASPAAGYLMQKNAYQILGIYPVGAAYLYVNNRSLNSLAELKNKKIGIIETDPAQRALVQSVNAVPITSPISAGHTITNYMDACAAPAVLYQTLKFYKDMANQGGIVRFPLSQLTLQMIAHKNAFSKEFNQNARQFAVNNFDTWLNIIKVAEERIPEKIWLDIAEMDMPGYEEMFRQTRIQLRDEGIYDKTMLHIMRNLRCKMDVNRAECRAIDQE